MKAPPHRPRLPRFLPLATAAAALGLAACGVDSESSVSGPAAAGAGSGSRPVIGATCLTTSNPFFKVIEENMREEADRHGFDLVYLDGNFDVNRQQNQVKDFIVQGVAAIAINPCDSKAIGPAIAEANEAGIPVFTFDIKCQAEGVEVAAHIATDNFQGGTLAAEAVIEGLGEEGGKVVVLDFRAVESCLQRVAGFKEVIAAHNEGRQAGRIEIVAELPGDGQKDKGFKATEDALQSHPDLDAIFAINDPSALGAIAALEKAGRNPADIVIVAFDGQPEGKAAIRDGKIYADPVQFPDKIGRQTVRAIVAHLNGEAVEPEVLIPAALYRKADAEGDPDLQ